MTHPYVNSWWPTDFNGCTMTGTFVGLDGQPIAGTITFAATPLAMLDFTSLKTIVPRALTATLDSNGHFSIILPATDDPDISPQNFTYTVTQNWIGGRVFSVEAPQNTTVDITTVSPVPDSLGNPIVRGPRGIDGSLISVLGVDGDDAGNADISSLVPLLANNLGDLPDANAARVHLGLGSAATQSATYFALAAATTTALASKLTASNNLSDLTSASAARTALGLGTAATQDANDWGQGYLGAAEDVSTHITLATLGHLYASPPAGNITCTFTTTRRVLVAVRTTFVNYSSVIGNYDAGPAYAAGDTLTDSNLIQLMRSPSWFAGSGQGGYTFVFGTILCTPGDYTFGGFVERISGGGATDIAGLIAVQVIDLGNT